MSRYKGKYLAPQKKRPLPLGAAALILLAVLSLSIGSVVAYLSTHTGAVKNTFLKDEPTNPSVLETFDPDGEKTDVKVSVGDPGYAVYVRAAVVVTWKDADGNVLGTAPAAGTDYTLDINPDAWVLGSDGFYYHKAPVNTAGETAVLITRCAPLDGKTPQGYGLNVEIVTQTVQALGTTDEGGKTPVEDAWGVTLVDGKIQ